MRAMTGRAVSAAIHQRLEDALAQGEPRTYQQLADHAGCTVRSVRNYLERAEEIFGFPVEKTRDEEHRIVVRAVGATSTRSRPRGTAPDPLATALTRALFPNPSDSSSASPVIVALPGLPTYGAHQARAVRLWAEAAAAKRPRALRLRHAIPTGGEVYFPTAVVVHNVSGVVLLGAPTYALGLDDGIAIALEDVPDEPGACEAVHNVAPPPVSIVKMREASTSDLPFTLRTPSSGEPLVRVHVRFGVPVAARLQGRLWHRSQRVVVRRDGELDVRFGPVPLADAASWAAAFGDAIRVLGDKKLRKAVKKGSFVPGAHWA